MARRGAGVLNVKYKFKILFVFCEFRSTETIYNIISVDNSLNKIP